MIDGRQGYRIKSGEQVVAEDTLSAEPGVFTKSFEAVFELTPGPDGVVVLDIETERLATPASLGINEDIRTLGIALGEIVVQPE